MARKKKEFDKNGIFQTRFRAEYYKTGLKQDALAKTLGVSRPTLIGWLDGKNIPDILSLEKIARFFGVSADYLLGLSDTMSPDVTVKAAMEYTGLDEAAVEWLHIGLDDFECDGVGMPEESKKENWRTASALIQSRAFTNIIHHLNEVKKEAYMEKILTTLEDEYSESDAPDEASEFHYASRDDRKVVESNLIHVLKTKGTLWEESTQDEVWAMNDDELACDVLRALWSAKQASEVRQFHAAKAFSGYIDELIEESYKKAEKRFEMDKRKRN